MFFKYSSKHNDSRQYNGVEHLTKIRSAFCNFPLIHGVSRPLVFILVFLSHCTVIPAEAFEKLKAAVHALAVLLQLNS